MPESTFHLELPVPVSRLWDFHALPDAVQRLSPPGEGLRVLRHGHPLQLYGETLISMPFLPGARICWLARIVEFEEGRRFVDEQIEGPMSFWRHEHRLEDLGAQSCRLIDHIDWRLRWWQLPPLCSGLVRRRLDALFSYRHQVIRDWCMGPQGSE
ncbi:MAG: hypothetical protein EA402_14705 [Planctomycetota bacterium]|nr:MAG: hypothetical protein EA402_14705 [Planctomycetota bacterium]